MSSAAVIGGFVASFGTASILGLVGIIVHLCRYPSNPRERILARRRSFIEQARRNHIDFSRFSVSRGTGLKALDMEDIECFCPQVKYSGFEKELQFIHPQDNVPVPLTLWLEEQKHLQVPGTNDVWLSFGDCSQQENTEARLAKVDGSEDNSSRVVAEPVDNTNCQSRSYIIPFSTGKVKNEKYPLLIGRDILTDETCAICLDNIEIGNNVRILCCGHAFHNTCLIHWLTSANRCPLCNTAAVSDDDKQWIEKRRSQVLSNVPSIWPLSKPQLTREDMDKCIYRTFQKILVEVDSRLERNHPSVGS